MADSATLQAVLAADRIVVPDQGRVVEEGTPGSLGAQGGPCAKLARHQFERIAA